MVYFYKFADYTTIVTDTVRNVIPANVKIYLEDTLLGTYENQSTNIQYYRVTIPNTDIINFESREYQLTWKNAANDDDLKKELCIVLDDKQLSINTINKQKTIIMYNK